MASYAAVGAPAPAPAANPAPRVAARGGAGISYAFAEIGAMHYGEGDSAPYIEF